MVNKVHKVHIIPSETNSSYSVRIKKALVYTISHIIISDNIDVTKGNEIYQEGSCVIAGTAMPTRFIIGWA